MPNGKMRFTNLEWNEERGTRFALYRTGTPLMIDTRHILNNKRKLMSFQIVPKSYRKHLFNTKRE